MEDKALQKREEEPLLIDAIFSMDYGLIKEAPGIKLLTAFRDGLHEYRRRRELWNLQVFFGSFESIETDEKTRKEFFERFKAREDREDILNVLPEFLADRNAQLRLKILARLMHALVEGELAVERFYDLSEVLEKMNVRSIRFLSTMESAGFEIRGDLDEFTEESSLLVAAGVALREGDMLRVNSLGRELHQYVA